jgi:hypothetical protein
MCYPPTLVASRMLPSQPDRGQRGANRCGDTLCLPANMSPVQKDRTSGSGLEDKVRFKCCFFTKVYPKQMGRVSHTSESRQ